MREGNTSKDGIMVRGTNAKNLGHQLRWFVVCKEPCGPKHRDKEEQGEVAET